MGDEVYKVAFTWLAVGIIGADTGYLTAIASVSLVLVALFGGKWSDHWDHLRTLFWVDVIRGFIVLLPVAASYYFSVSLPLLSVVAILVAGLSGFFDPALLSILQRYSPDTTTLQAATGLMSTTFRMARMTGPMVIAALTAYIPTIHFFTIDAFSFFASAFTIYLLRSHPVVSDPSPVSSAKTGVFENLKIAFQTVKQSPTIFRALTIKALSGGTWWVAYGLGIALLVKERLGGSVQVYGWVMGSYGVGNFIAAIFFGSRERKNQEWMLYFAHILLGVGFVWVAFSPSVLSLMIAAAYAAIFGPMNDIPFLDMVQERFHGQELKRIFRLRLATETLCSLLLLLPAPFLFRTYGARNVIFSFAIFLSILGIYGLFARKSERT